MPIMTNYSLIRFIFHSYNWRSTFTLPSMVREKRARHRARSGPVLSLSHRPHQDPRGRSPGFVSRGGGRTEAEKLAHEYLLRGSMFTHLATLLPSINLSMKQELQVCF